MHLYALLCVCAVLLTDKFYKKMIVTPDKIKEGQSGVIKHWVNQPQYVGDTIRKENGKLIRTTQTNKIDTESVDMRYHWWCKVELQ